jgi:3-phenylpropionate/trans-cinnamate dioxygenase ferredoxin reductase subunit
MTDNVLIVGASVAGVGLANELRRDGYAGEITLVDGQPHLPYDRPPLSKAALSDPTGVRVHFHDADYYREHGITLKLGVPVTRFDAAARTIELASGDLCTAEAVVIATGARARSFPTGEGSGHIHLLRDLDHADQLRAELVPGKSLAIIGGGFIGAEVASSAARMGVEVVLLEAAMVPFERLLGTKVSERLALLHRERGVDLRCGASVLKIEKLGSGKSRLIMADETTVEADIIVAGLGSLPNVEWLEGAGLTVSNGVICDEHGKTGWEGVYAVGDVAAWRNVRTGLHERHEHWTAAREQARIVAHDISGAVNTDWSDFIPYFWSDFHGKRIQVLGATKAATSVQFVFEDVEKGAFVAEYYCDGVLIGVVGCNAASRTMRYTTQLAQPASV